MDSSARKRIHFNSTMKTDNNNYSRGVSASRSYTCKLRTVQQQLQNNDVNLREIELEGWPKARIIEMIPFISLHSNLSAISIPACNLGDKGVILLSRALSHHPLVKLNLSGNLITNVGAEALGELRIPTLHDLNVSWNAISDQGLSFLSEGLVARGLRKLELDGIVIEGRGGGSRRLGLDCGEADPPIQNVAEEGCRALARVLRTSRLVHLSLSRQKLNSAGVAVIASTLKHAPLTHLELQRIPVDDEGAIALARALPSSSLETLELMINRITNTGALELANALMLDNTLVNLGLTQNEIGKEGLQALSEAAAVNTRLFRLDVYGHATGKAGSPFVWKIKPWIRLNQSTSAILGVRTDLYTYVLAKAARLQDATRLYKNVREMVQSFYSFRMS